MNILEINPAAFPRPLAGAIQDAVLVCQFRNMGVHQPGQRVRLRLQFMFGFQFLRIPNLFMPLPDKTLNGGQNGGQLFFRHIAAKGYKLSHLPLFAKVEVQPGVGHLPPSYIQRGGVLQPRELLQDEGTINASQQPGRARDYVEGIGRPSLAGVVDYQHRHQKVVSNLF